MTDRGMLANDLLRVLFTHSRVPSPDMYLLTGLARYINSLFCPCRYVEYWAFDLDFGRNISDSDMGYELRDIDSPEKLIQFLLSKT